MRKGDGSKRSSGGEGSGRGRVTGRRETVNNEDLLIMADAMGQEAWRLTNVTAHALINTLTWKKKVGPVEVRVTMKAMGGGPEEKTVGGYLMPLLKEHIPGYIVRGEYRTVCDLLAFEQEKGGMWVSMVSLRGSAAWVQNFLTEQGIYGAWAVAPDSDPEMESRSLEEVQEQVLGVLAQVLGVLEGIRIATEVTGEA